MKIMNKLKGAVLLILALSAGSIYAQQEEQVNPQVACVDSINTIIHNAEQGDAVAQNEVGKWYFWGLNNVQPSDSLAVRWWSKSAAQGNERAIGNLGLCYQHGRGVEADSIRAIELYTLSINKGNRKLFDNHLELASKGSVFSNVFLAMCYQKGIGTSRDIQKCVEHYQAASQLNSPDAQRELGLLCMTVNKPEKAVNYFKSAAEKEDLTSVYYYGQLLFDGKGIEKDEAEGLIYMLKAAEANFAQAQYAVGVLYAKGTAVVKDAEQAFKWYYKAAEQQHVRAQLAVADSYIKGVGVSMSYRQALDWYAISYSQKAKSVIRNMALGETGEWKETPFWTYLEGMKLYYVDKDPESAMKKFKELEKLGIVDGIVMQSVILSDESYKKHDRQKSLEIMDKYAESNPYAAYLYGLEYENGTTLSKDMDRAIELYTYSAEMGFAASQCRLGDIYYEGRGVETDYEKAVKYYMMALKQNSLTEISLKRLASCYSNGWGNLPKDKRKASNVLKNKTRTSIMSILELITVKEK